VPTIQDLKDEVVWTGEACYGTEENPKCLATAKGSMASFPEKCFFKAEAPIFSKV
jgi:hypothetical protein